MQIDFDCCLSILLTSFEMSFSRGWFTLILNSSSTTLSLCRVVFVCLNAFCSGFCKVALSAPCLAPVKAFTVGDDLDRPKNMSWQQILSACVKKYNKCLNTKIFPQFICIIIKKLLVECLER